MYKDFQKYFTKSYTEHPLPCQIKSWSYGKQFLSNLNIHNLAI